MKYSKLKNGLSVLVHQMPNTHSVTIGLYIKAGCMYEDDAHIGITHFLEHLHFRKLGSISQKDLYYKMERIGSTLRAATYRDFLKFSMKVAPSMIRECMEIFENLFQMSDWSDEEFEKEKQVVINQIIEKGNYISIEKEVRNIVFNNHTLSREIMGRIENIKVLSKHDVLEYKKKIFVSDNMLFCITGNVSDLVCENITKSLQQISLSKQNIVRNVECPKDFHRRKPNIYLKNIQDDYPVEINISFDVTYDERTKDLLTILNCILGEGVGSKLQRYIREEKCYSSDVKSFIEWYKNYAVLHIRLSVDKINLLECLIEIKEILKYMKEEVSRKDLDVTLPFYTTNQMFLEDDTEQMNFQLAYHTFILESEHRQVKLKNTESTILMIQQLATEILTKKNMSIVIVGNMKRITKKSILEIMSDI